MNIDTDQLKASLDIVKVIGDAIDLNRKGREYVGICPFHNDTDPSMTVEPHKQFFKCFVCDAGGDVVSFVQKFYGLTFQEAVERLSGGKIDNLPKRTAPRRISRAPERPAILDWSKYEAKFTCSHLRMEAWAKKLGVHWVGMDWVEMGWSKKDKACTFPMRDAAGHVIGYRLRNGQGDKWAVEGSRNGLFYPVEIQFYTNSPFWMICEGPTDTAAMVSLGFPTVGRPNTFACFDQMRLLFAKWKHPAVIVADTGNEGLASAAKLANLLTAVCPWVKVIKPKSGKDARQWVAQGATTAIVEQTIKETPAWKRQRAA